MAAFLEPFAPLFRRTESRETLERYVTGLLTDLPRKNCDTTAAAVAGTSTERLQHLLTDADWDPLALDEQRVRALAAQSPAGGLLILDDTSFPKQGVHQQRRVHRGRAWLPHSAALAGHSAALSAGKLGA